MKTSESSSSRYLGNPLSVLRAIDGIARDQPKPSGPFPDAESYVSDSCGPKPERAGLVAIGSDMDAVPCDRIRSKLLTDAPNRSAALGEIDRRKRRALGEEPASRPATGVFSCRSTTTFA